MYYLMLLTVDLLFMNILLMMLQHLTLQLRYHRLEDFIIVLRSPVIKLIQEIFHIVLVHIMLLFFLHKGLNLLMLSLMDRINIM